MTVSQSDKAMRFRELHQQPAFVIPNPRDAGSARLLTELGFRHWRRRAAPPPASSASATAG
jgi:2-methylisocitrate lyase-like PEP mutase family enzyme